MHPENQRPEIFAEMTRHVKGCEAVASCLGHNMSIKGIYGHPRRLVTDATRRLCNAIKANKPVEPVKLVLMNTANRWKGQMPVIYNKASS